MEILRPISNTLDHLQGDVFYGDLLPSLLLLQLTYKEMESKTFTFGLPLVSSINESIKKRFKSLLLLGQEAKQAFLATCSHPSFKLKWLNNFPEKREEIKKIFIETAATLSLDRPNPFHSEPEHQETDDKWKLLFGQNEEPTPKVAGIEVLQYLEDRDSSLQVLQKYKVVGKMFLEYNTTLPSSAAVERLFSFATLLNEPRRRNLTDDQFGRLVFMKGNWSAMKKH